MNLRMYQTSYLKSEKGAALLFAVIISVLLMALGLGLTLSSLSEFSMSNEFESHKQSLLIADAGLNGAEALIRGKDISEVLNTAPVMPTFFSSGPTDPRNPMTLAEARNVDYYNLPSAVGSVELSGLVTPPLGAPLGRGRYFARVSDNNDGDGNPFMDLDHIIFIRSFGVQPGPPNQVVMNGSNLKNSVSVVEAMLKRDLSFDVSSPFTVYGPETVPDSSEGMFNGNSFLVDGYDHSHQSVAQIRAGSDHNHNGDIAEGAGVSAVYNGPPNDASTSVGQIEGGLNENHVQDDNIIGAGGEPSIRDETEMIRNNSNPDATNIFDALYLMTFLEKVVAAADVVYEDGTELSGSNIVLGTEEKPQITVASGDLSISGGGEGNGLLIIKGHLDYSGAFDYNGLILVIGEGGVSFSGANKAIIGGIYVAQLLEDENGNPYFGIPSFSLSGQSFFYFRGDSIRMAMNLLPFKKLAWREITQEMLPPATVHEEPSDSGDGGGIGIIGVTE